MNYALNHEELKMRKRMYTVQKTREFLLGFPHSFTIAHMRETHTHARPFRRRNIRDDICIIESFHFKCHLYSANKACGSEQRTHARASARNVDKIQWKITRQRKTRTLRNAREHAHARVLWPRKNKGMNFAIAMCDWKAIRIFNAKSTRCVIFIKIPSVACFFFFL